MQIHLLMYCNLPLCWPKPPPSICKIIRVKVTAMTKKFRVLLCGGDVKGKPFFLNPAFSLLLLLLSCSVCNLNLLLPNDLSNHPFLKKMRTGGLANFRRFFAISHNLSPCVGAKWFTYHPLSFLFSTPISKKRYPKKTYWHRFCCSWAIMISRLSNVNSHHYQWHHSRSCW